MGAIDPAIHRALHEGIVIPACPLVLTADRQLDAFRQRRLLRYYVAAGAGGLALGVHTTQFAIREAGLFQPLLALAAQELDAIAPPAFVRIGGICGQTPQAEEEARTLHSLGYHCGLLSLGALRSASENELIQHATHIAEIIPIIGFYLQPAVGGRVLSYAFWRRFAEIQNVVAIKIAPFNRYQTLDVIRAVSDAAREDIALYTGNDDNIVADLLTTYGGRRIVGGLLGQWAVWTRAALQLRERLKTGQPSAALLSLAAEITDANAAIFDAANGFAGCIPGIQEILRRQGLLEGTWCLDPNESLSPGQLEEIDRVCTAYPHLSDNEFVREFLGNSSAAGLPANAPT